MGQEFVAIECKAREPGGVVDVEEIEHWLSKIKVMQGYIRQNRDREAQVKFEIWTTGDFTPQALELLQTQKRLRTKTPIDWKTGRDVVEYASQNREKSVADVLRQHFVKHPLAV